MRTVIVPPSAAVQAQLAELDPRLRRVTEGFIARLRLEPFLGHPLRRGQLASLRSRAVRFDRDWRPENLLAGRNPGPRRGDQDASEGPPWRVVYVVRELSARGLRLVVVLAVGRAHRDPGERDVYDVASEAANEMRRRSR